MPRVVEVKPEELMSVLQVPKRTALYLMQHHTYSPTGRKLVEGKVIISDTLYGTAIDNDHRNPVKMVTQHGKLVNVGGRGWKNGLGYHILINANGVVEVGQRWINQLVGAHCKEARMNVNSLGIALVGNFDVGKDTVSDAQKTSWVKIARVLSEAYNIPLTSDHILLHRHYAYAPYPPKEDQKPYKSCPGTSIMVGTYTQWLQEE